MIATAMLGRERVDPSSLNFGDLRPRALRYPHTAFARRLESDSVGEGALHSTRFARPTFFATPAR